ncbi:MAG: hypothetical protein NTX91_01595 [candidate division SR1 bacterium]|nr:hypothetical protein [candidate division SR1 bacterium]
MYNYINLSQYTIAKYIHRPEIATRVSIAKSLRFVNNSCGMVLVSAKAGPFLFPLRTKNIGYAQ